MNHLEVIFGQMQGQLISFQLNLELVHLQSRANSISSAVFSKCLRETEDFPIDDLLKEDAPEWLVMKYNLFHVTYMNSCSRRINNVFNVNDKISDAIPEEFVKDSEVVDKYNLLSDAERAYVYSLCEENLYIAINDYEQLSKIAAEIQKKKIDIFAAREELDKVLMRKAFENQKNKIITSASMPQKSLIDFNNLRLS